jgi:predicted alpha/beta-hydrolase family hydrolase
VKRPQVVLLPGYQGSADQAILVRVEHALSELECLRIAPPRLKVTPELTAYVDWLEAAVKGVRGPLIVIGRSFGGRLAIRLAARRSLAGVVLLGFPIRPPGRPRPIDEAALAALKCPTLIVQGSKDELGPLRVLEPLIATKKNVTLEVLKGAGHSFGSKEKQAIECVARWARLV